MNIIIPLGGKGERFSKYGYTSPKPLIQIFEKCMIDYVIDNLYISDNDNIFIIYNTNLDNYHFSTYIHERYPFIHLINICDTKGAVETLFLGIEKIIRNYKSIESHLKLQTFKKWCFLNLSLLELDRLILFSYGMKKMKDINGMFTYIGDSQSEQELYELISSNFYSKKSDFSFVDIGIENTKYWHDSWKSDIIRIYEKLKVRSSIAVCTNPKCYYYFNGLKMIKKNEKRFDNDYIFIVF